MRILDTYFKDGVPSAVAVPMSEACRKSTLTFRASSAFIFDRARDEMLERMGLQKIPRASLVMIRRVRLFRPPSKYLPACLPACLLAFFCPHCCRKPPDKL